MTNRPQEHLLSVPAGIAVSITTKEDWSSIFFEAGPAIKEVMSMNRGCYDDDGKEVPEGELRRRWLHAKLEEWINENLKDKK